MNRLFWLVALAPPGLYLAARFGFPILLPPVPVPSPVTATPFEPIAFFEGATHGKGTLTTVTGESKKLAVNSTGRRLADGSLELTQAIEQEGKPGRTRKWVIRPEEGGRYGGSLTDANGDVTAYAGGRRMVIGYDTKDGTIRQTLTQVDGTTVRNRLDVYKWGLNVARLDETITRD